jgi:hypothetical protein
MFAHQAANFERSQAAIDLGMNGVAEPWPNSFYIWYSAVN